MPWRTWWIAATCIAAFPLPCAADGDWIDLRRGRATGDALQIAIAADGRVRLRLERPWLPAPADSAPRALNRYEIHFLGALVERCRLREQAEASGAPKPDAPEVRLTVVVNGKAHTVRRAVSADVPAGLGDPELGPMAMLEGGLRWVVGAGVLAARSALAAADAALAAGKSPEALALARRAVGEATRFFDPLAPHPDAVYSWYVPGEHPVHEARAAFTQAATRGDAAAALAAAREWLDRLDAVHADALAGLGRRLAFFAPGETEAGYADRWTRSAQPRPFDWGKPEATCEEARLAFPEEPTTGVRFARSGMWPPPEPASAGLDGLPAGARVLGRQPLLLPSSGVEVGEAVIAWFPAAGDGGSLSLLERLMSGVPAHRIHARVFRDGPLQGADALWRQADGDVVRWTVCQSGKGAAAMRARVAAKSYAPLADLLAVAAGSLEPMPRAPRADVEGWREVSVAGLHLEVPADWRDEAGGGPGGADFRDWFPASGACRLWVRATPLERALERPVQSVWSTFGRPSAPREVPSGPAQVDASCPATQVGSAGRGVLALESGWLPYGTARVPVWWFTVSDGTVLATVALAAETDDPAARAAARACIEYIAASAR